MLSLQAGSSCSVDAMKVKGTRQSRPHESEHKCNKCGIPHKPRACPAYGQSCRNCGKQNYLEHYPIPTCNEVVSKLAGKSVFTVIDQKDGFWQIKHDESSSRLCTFNTPFGRYSMKRLPFGISSSPEAFQKTMNSFETSIEST